MRSCSHAHPKTARRCSRALFAVRPGFRPSGSRAALVDPLQKIANLLAPQFLNMITQTYEVTRLQRRLPRPVEALADRIRRRRGQYTRCPRGQAMTVEPAIFSLTCVVLTSSNSLILTTVNAVAEPSFSQNNRPATGLRIESP